ncbi:MAG TPA: hypothetical protein VFW55_09355 [Propionicimonas sp.]|nr:hypothetical protein [Propionicimonas sp.]
MIGFWFWFWVVVGLGAVVGAVLVVRRRRYVGKVRALGWTLDPNPSLTRVADLNAPPFGLGLRRSVDELVSGTTASGHAFRVFDYDYSGAGRGYSARIACLQLPFGLPDVFLTDSDRARTGISPAGVPLVQAEEGTLRAIAADGSLASQVLVLVAPGIAAAGGLADHVDLSIDGDQLVVAGAPKDPDDLQAFLAGFDPIASALSDTALRGHEVATAADRFGFYGHPDWRFGPDGTEVLDYYPVTTGGFGHLVTDPITGLRDGIRMDAFTHEWKTTRTETYTDSEGHSHTRTVTDNHSEPVCGFLLPFDLPGLSVNGRRLGEKVAFESAEFNRAFTVRAEDPKFASDVIHPRTMEWLLATNPRGWTVQQGVVVFEVEDHDQLLVDACEATLRGWLGRIPRFVWADRGLTVPPYLVE